MTFYDQKFGNGTIAKKPALTPKSTSTSPVQAKAAQSVASSPKFVQRRATLAYGALLTFSFLYYARPEDFIPGMAIIPVGKISGGLALAGLLLSWARLKTKMPLVIKLVLVLFVHMCLTVPFAFWRGGAFQVVRDDFSKAVIVALLISMIVGSMDDLRRLLWVQAVSVSVMTIASIIIHPQTSLTGQYRLWGLGGVFSNPNDFAINIAINFPLCLAFFYATKGILKKVLWGGALLFLLYGVIATYSRSGLIAMVICFMICVWEFGIRGKRPQVVAAAIFVVMLGLGVGLTKPNYTARIKTLVEGGEVENSGDHGSLDARRELLMESIRVSLHHPIFGVGPGNFQAITESWHVTHNTYTELSSEAGLPALALFLTIIVLTFRNLKHVSKSAAFETDPQLRLFTSALRAGMFAYIVGAAFASTTYNLFPYFMVGYVAALYRIGLSAEPEPVQSKPTGNGSLSASKGLPYKNRQPSLARTY
ncbi:MAG TPA: O-antigen ligase family protein [Terriglobales bacterium]|nr:O-antigen ligase family protein [Terriglobales bacterium]